MEPSSSGKSSSAVLSPSAPAGPSSASSEVAVLDVSFVDPGIVERQNPAFMVAAQQQSPEDGAAKFKRGLSPFMLELNRYLQAARLSNGSSLTRD